jgi:hypothetical protein
MLTGWLRGPVVAVELEQGGVPHARGRSVGPLHPEQASDTADLPVRVVFDEYLGSG